MTKMQFDEEPGYLDALRTFRKIMKFKTLREAELQLWPIRAAKREMKRQERVELSQTCIRRKIICLRTKKSQNSPIKSASWSP
jgi:hypothetical protein